MSSSSQQTSTQYPDDDILDNLPPSELSRLDSIVARLLRSSPEYSGVSVFQNTDITPRRSYPPSLPSPCVRIHNYRLSCAQRTPVSSSWSSRTLQSVSVSFTGESWDKGEEEYCRELEFEEEGVVRVVGAVMEGVEELLKRIREGETTVEREIEGLRELRRRIGRGR